MMQGVEGDIKYVMPQSGKIKTAELKIDALADQSFATAHISQGGSSGQANFKFYLKVKNPNKAPYSIACCQESLVKAGTTAKIRIPAIKSR